MGIYETLLIFGFLGLAVMTLLGFVHVGHHGGHSHGNGHGLHGHHAGHVEAGHALDVQHGAGHGHAPLGPAHTTHGHGHASPVHGHADHGHAAPAHGHAHHGPHAHGTPEHEAEAPGGMSFLPLLGLLSPLT